MLFQGEGGASLRLDLAGYELRPDEGDPGSDDRNWLVLRCAWTDEEGTLRRDSNSCLLTYELRELSAGLKVLRSGIRTEYHSEFLEPYFQVDAWAEGEAFRLDVRFVLPNTMDGEDTAELTCRLTEAELRELTEELDRLSERYPDRL